MAANFTVFRKFVNTTQLPLTILSDIYFVIQDTERRIKRFDEIKSTLSQKLPVSEDNGYWAN